MAQNPLSRWEQVVWWLLYGVGWVGASTLAFWLVLQVRINLIDLNQFLGWGPWLLGAVDKFGLVVLGLGWLIGVFVIEMALRSAPTLPSLGRQLLRIGGTLALALAVSYTLQWILAW